MLFFTTAASKGKGYRCLTLFALWVTGFVILYLRVFGRQDAVQFLDKLQKFCPVLFHGDLRAKILNTVAF